VPYDGPPLTVLAQILTQPVPGPRDVRPDVDPPLDGICRKAMSKEPAKRYASMEEFAAALADYLRGGNGVPTQVFDDSLGMEPAEVARSSGSHPAVSGTPAPAPRKSGPQRRVRAATPPPRPATARPTAGPLLAPPQSPVQVFIIALAGCVITLLLILAGLWFWAGGGFPFGHRTAPPTAVEPKP
jgi:serine/threonine-protein kinase